MKHSKTCPKCEGTSIVCVDIDVAKWSDAPYIPMGYTKLSSIPVPRYVCCSCGYSEEWIDEDELARLQEKYPKVF